jgi:hypothetical protein
MEINEGTSKSDLFFTLELLQNMTKPFLVSCDSINVINVNKILSKVNLSETYREFSNLKNFCLNASAIDQATRNGLSSIFKSDLKVVSYLLSNKNNLMAKMAGLMSVINLDLIAELLKQVNTTSDRLAKMPNLLDEKQLLRMYAEDVRNLSMQIRYPICSATDSSCLNLGEMFPQWRSFEVFSEMSWNLDEFCINSTSLMAKSKESLLELSNQMGTITDATVYGKNPRLNDGIALIFLFYIDLQLFNLHQMELQLMPATKKPRSSRSAKTKKLKNLF